MVASQQSGILCLPAELHRAIFCLLVRNSEDIVALREIHTCKALYEVEKKHHTSIWNLCIQSLIDEAALFSPTFTWHPPSLKLQEQLVRRASCFKKALCEYQENALTGVAPRETLELKFPEDVSDFFLLPGGRFLVGISSPTISVFDLAPYYESGGSPIQIGSFPSPYYSERFTCRAVTFVGEKADKLRFLLAYDADPLGFTPNEDYDVGEDEEEYLYFVEVHEISFAGEELALTMYGPLPLCRDESDTANSDIYTMSEDCIGAVLGARNALVWNYVEDMYQIFTLENHETETPSDILLTEDRFVVFSVKQTEKDSKGNQGYHGGDMVSYQLQPLQPLDLPDREALTVPHQQSPAPAPTTSSFRKALPLVPTGLKGLSPSRTSRASWGYSVGQHKSSPYPLHDYLRKENGNPAFHLARRHYAPENIVDTHWLHLGLGDSPDAPGTATPIATFPLQDPHWLVGDFVSILQWEQDLRDDPHHRKGLSLPPALEDKGAGSVSQVSLAWDLCPLAGIMVMQQERGQESSIEIHDYVRAYLQKQG
ncbi:hypothetical protein BKA70DRAFT_1313422 [Coprinopsis sp. MPI-PUGE-AT-0042]|nr:hypothetical protein BKA70DRAFT_1313422 [Coprinopsis sp. MPI-PUGE-AT-0042]